MLASLVLFLVAGAVFGQPAWWEPSAPVIGQTFTIYYDDIEGTLPDNSSEVWLHWGIYDPLTGNWSIPPQSSWPLGSQGVGSDACQSPMVRGTDDIWYVEIDPDTTMESIAFVFTDMQNNWDNNSGNNWIINFISGEEPSWYVPEDPVPGDELTIYYNANAGTIPAGASNLKLHWGVNETAPGAWLEPPQSIWPPGTISTGSGMSAQTPMISLGEGIWSLSIQTNDSIYTLHYVFTDDVNWDNNSGNNWNILLEEPPPSVLTWHTFRYDARSRWATFNLEDINSVVVAGTFNGWSSSANPLIEDENGVFKLEVQIPIGANNYKFVVNGSNWVQDPDNPNTDASSYMNSQVTTELDTVPYFTDIQPPDGNAYMQGAIIDISAKVRPADNGPGIMGEPAVVAHGSLGADTLDIIFDPSTGELTGEYTLGANWDIHLEFLATDSSGNVGIYDQWVEVIAMIEGYIAGDPKYDDKGGGDYTYPAGFSGSVDLKGLTIADWEDEGDSLYIELQIWDTPGDASILFQICTEVDGFYYDPPLFNTETAAPDWNGNGVQICLKDPLSSSYDPTIHNRIISMRDPVVFGPSINVYPGTAIFMVAVADLEEILGTYNRGWYWSICSFLDGPAGTTGHSWEVDAEHGGSDEIFDPDVFDMMFTDDRELQKILLSNYSGNRRASLDNVGRGFALIFPEDIGPNIGSSGPQIDILTRGAPTIIPEQTITGVADLTSPTSVYIIQEYEGGEHAYLEFNVSDTFNVDIELEEGANTIYARIIQGGETTYSPSIIFDLEVDHSPEAVISVAVDNGTVTLDASQSTDPDGDDIEFLWEADPDNPEVITLNNSTSDICTFTAPAVSGEYYVNLTIQDPDSNITHARSFATVYADSVHGFEWNESAQWIRDAIIYEIFPRSYSADHQLSSVTDDMERIAALGVNAIWFMPIMPGPTDHGYAITDYYGIEEDYGTPEDFAELTEAAHSFDIKIIIDLVINHSSIEHPFMLDAIDFDIYSHYYDYYDRDAQGNHTYYYDWYSLPNLNYDNLDVWKYFIDMCKWWVDEYDIDGFRCDVAWGVQQRNPDFWIEWRNELKKQKPEIFLLAEAGGNDFTYYDYRFDSAYDWNLHHEGNGSFVNMFNGVPNIDDIHDLVTNYGYYYPDYKFPFRFLENHDEERYIAFNTLQETKLAAALLMTIPGIPMIYAGQEIGTLSQRGQINWSSDPNNLSVYYEHLCQIRSLFPAVSSDTVERLNNSQYSAVYSIGRYIEGEYPVISVMNFTPGSQVVTVDIPSEEWGLHPDSTYCLNEFIGDDYYWMTGAQLAQITTSVDGRSARVYAITDSVITLDVEEPETIPVNYALHPSYPNPFNSDCLIKFNLPAPMKVHLAVYNVLGQEVKVLTDKVWDTGEHTVKWDGRSVGGSELSSGMYFYRLRAGDFIKTRKMVLIR